MDSTRPYWSENIRSLEIERNQRRVQRRNYSLRCKGPSKGNFQHKTGRDVEEEILLGPKPVDWYLIDRNLERPGDDDQSTEEFCIMDGFRNEDLRIALNRKNKYILKLQEDGT